MVDKNVRLKSSNDEGGFDYLYPATKSKIVDVNGKNLDETLDEFTAQLAQKVDEGNVKVSDINKNFGLLDETYLSDSLKSQIAGTATLGATPPDSSVTPIKTTFFKNGKNLFNKEDILLGVYLNGTTGLPTINNENYFVSNFIRILPNTKYSLVGYENVAFYNSEKKFISFVTPGSEMISTSDSYYVRFSAPKDNLNTIQLEIGSSKTAYEPYKMFFDTSLIIEKSITNNLIGNVNGIKIDDGSVLPKKINGYERGKNLFDKKNVEFGKFVNSQYGTLGSNVNYVSSDYIEVTPDSTYTMKYAQYSCFYDAEKKALVGSGFSEVSPNTFVTPINAKFIRISATLSQLETQQLELGSHSTPYEPFTYHLTNLSVKENNPFRKNNLVTYGDSITASGVWQSHVINKIGFNKQLNLGLSDSSVTSEDKTLYVNANGTYNSNPLNTPSQPSGTTEIKASFCEDERIAYIPEDTDLVLIMGGTNDFFRGLPIGEPMYPYDEKTFMGALSSTHKKIQDRIPNATIVLMTPIQMAQAIGNPAPRKNSLNLTLTDYANAVREVAEYLGCPLIDVNTQSGINLHNTVLTSSDGVHPTPLGHKLIAKAVIGGLKTLEPV